MLHSVNSGLSHFFGRVEIIYVTKANNKHSNPYSTITHDAFISYLWPFRAWINYSSWLVSIVDPGRTKLQTSFSELGTAAQKHIILQLLTRTIITKMRFSMFAAGVVNFLCFYFICSRSSSTVSYTCVSITFSEKKHNKTHLFLFFFVFVDRNKKLYHVLVMIILTWAYFISVLTSLKVIP